MSTTDITGTQRFVWNKEGRLIMLHILNGSSVEDTLRQSSVPGELFSFRDALIAGPTPSGLAEDDWRQTRAAHLSESYGEDRDTCERDLLEQSQKLASFAQHEEVVFWFEHDLFCQLNLLYLLNWYSEVDLGTTRLSMVNIGQFPGRENFRGLGELNADELASLYPHRQVLSATELQLAREAWAAFCSTDPTSIERVLQDDTSALPFLDKAFVAHLRRFPSTRNGLGRIENSSLQLIADGRERFVELFTEFIAAESVYGLGDAQVWLSLVELANAKTPLLTTQNGQGAVHPTKKVATNMVFKLTDTGRVVLKGDADFVTMNEVDEWLGGVHLKGDKLWRWDEENGKLRYC